MQIGALALEERVGADGEENVEVTGRPAAHACFAFACKPDAGAILDPGGNVDRERALARHSSRAGTGRTRVIDHLTAALAGRTGPLQREEPLSMADASLTAARRTGFGPSAGLGARPRTGLAGHRGWNAHLGILSRIGLLQRNFHVVAQIGAALATAAASAPPAAHTEQVIEYVGEGRRYVAKAARGAGTGMLESSMAEAVVSGALVRILEDFISLINLLETDFAALVAGIAIGMPFHRQLAEGGFQFAFVRGALDPQNVVVAAFGHARVYPCHVCRGVIAESYPVVHAASKKCTPEVWPRGSWLQSKPAWRTPRRA